MHRPDCGRPPIYPVLRSLWHVTFCSFRCHSATSNPQSRLANHRDANPQPSQTPRHWGLSVLGPLSTNRPTRSKAAPNLDPIREGHSGSRRALAGNTSVARHRNSGSQSGLTGRTSVASRLRRSFSLIGLRYLQRAWPSTSVKISQPLHSSSSEFADGSHQSSANSWQEGSPLIVTS